jgi:hypothetical protein
MSICSACKTWYISLVVLRLVAATNIESAIVGISNVGIAVIGVENTAVVVLALVAATAAVGFGPAAATTASAALGPAAAGLSCSCSIAWIRSWTSASV